MTWFVWGEVPLYETSLAARLETHEALHQLDAPVSGKIVRTSNITQSAIGNKDGLWTTVFAACAFINDDN